MSTVDSGNETTVHAALAANKHKTVRKSAKGRKLMRWGPDEDQQLLLATEAVIIEGTVELDWNLVGEKMPQKVTGEAIKQHLYKVREARESAKMPTPTKAEGKSAFGSRRGVTRYPPVDQNTTTHDSKKRARLEPKTSRGKGKRAKEEDDDDEFTEKRSKTPSKIKHRSLLFGPAVPKDETSATSPPAGNELIIKLLTKKRRVREEPGEKAETVTTPKAPRKHAKKVKVSSEAMILGGTPSPIKKGGRSALPSNFNMKDRKEMLKRDSEASQVLVAHKGELPATDKTAKVASTTKELNTDVRNYFQPAAKKEVESKPRKLVGLVNTPIYTERALRTKFARPNYREDKAALSDDEQPERSEVEAITKGDVYERELVAGDGLEHANSSEKTLPPINRDRSMHVEDANSPLRLDLIPSQRAEQESVQPDGSLRTSVVDDARWPIEQMFAEVPGSVRQDAAHPPIHPAHYFDFRHSKYDGNPVMTDFGALLTHPSAVGAWYESEYERAQPPAFTPAPAPVPTQAWPYQWGSLGPYPTDSTLLEDFSSSNNSFPQYNESDVVVEQLRGVEMLEGRQLIEGQMHEGGQNLGVYSDPSFNCQWAYDQDEFEVMQ